MRTISAIAIFCLNFFAFTIFADSPQHQGSGSLRSDLDLRHQIESWRPNNMQLVDFDYLNELVRGIPADQARDGSPHEFALYDTKDACFCRNYMIKDKLMRYGVDLQRSTSSLFIVEAGDINEWSFHSVAVIYTNKGPYVFDTDNKSVQQIRNGDLLTPLSEWLKIKWSFNKSLYFMAPPGVVNPFELGGEPRIFKSTEDRLQYWDRYAWKTPDDQLLSGHSNRVGDFSFQRKKILKRQCATTSRNSAASVGGFSR